MLWEKRITVVNAHAEGEVGRIITSGVGEIPGASILEKKAYLERREDTLRRFCLFEPRGAAAMSVNLILPACDPHADIGMIVMESTDYPAMSGSNAICVTTVLLETGILPMKEPETRIVLDTPAGLVVATAACRAGKCERVSLESVPSFVMALDARIDVPGLGELKADIAYGGAFFAVVDAQTLGLELQPSEARRLVDLGQEITEAAAAQHPVCHPEHPEIRGIGFTLFGGPLRGEATDPEMRCKSAVVVAPGRLDRSPCGTGTAARLAILHARGDLKAGQVLIQESLIGTRFRAEVARQLTLAGRPAVVPRLSGRGWIFGSQELLCDPADPFPEGFALPDTWGPGLSKLAP